jgi:hypothetical protein
VLLVPLNFINASLDRHERKIRKTIGCVAGVSPTRVEAADRTVPGTGTSTIAFENDWEQIVSRDCFVVSVSFQVR